VALPASQSRKRNQEEMAVAILSILQVYLNIYFEIEK
jgi:hypothetical protein